MASYLEHNVVQDEIFPGVPFTVIQTPSKAMVHFTTIVNSGFNLAPKEKYELPHLLEHLAFEGNTTYPEGKAMSVELDTAAVYHNATTSTEYNWYDFSGPHASLELIQKHVVAQLYTPLFAEKSIAQQKQVIHNELHRKREDDSYRVWENITQALWQDVVLPIDERIAKLPTITRQDILDYYEERYRLKNLHFVVCGDLSESEIRDIKKYFKQTLASVPRGKYSPYMPKSGRISKQNIIISNASANDVTSFQLRFYLPTLDEQTLTARRVLRAYLVGGMGSVMFRELREAGLTYAISSFIMNDAEHSGFSFSDRVPHQNVVPLIKKCVQFLVDVADGKIDKVAFSRAKGLIINSQEAAFQRSSDFMNWYFNELQERRPLKSPEDYLHELNNVRENDLQKVAQKYLAKDSAHWLLSVASQDKNMTKAYLQKQLDNILS